MDRRLDTVTTEACHSLQNNTFSLQITKNIFLVLIFPCLQSFSQPDGFTISFVAYGRIPCMRVQPTARLVPTQDNTTQTDRQKLTPIP
jgi:hypothetical protein